LNTLMLGMLLITTIMFFSILILMDFVSYILKRFKRMRINTLSQTYLFLRWGYAYMLYSIYTAVVFDAKVPFRTILLLASPILLILPSILVHGVTTNCIKKRGESSFKKCRENLLCKNYLQLLPKPKIMTVCEEYENSG